MKIITNDLGVDRMDQVQKIAPPIDATFDKISVTIKAEQKDLQE